MALILHTLNTAVNTAYTAPAEGNGQLIISSNIGSPVYRLWRPGQTITTSDPTNAEGLVIGGHQLSTVPIPAGWSATARAAVNVGINTAPNSETGL